jgi:hypothetical protein
VSLKLFIQVMKYSEYGNEVKNLSIIMDLYMTCRFTDQLSWLWPGYTEFIKTQRQNFRNGFLIQRDEKKGMTTWVRKCVVTELSDHVFTECMPTRSDYWNKLRDTRYNCYTSNQVPNKFDVGLNTSKARAHDILSSPVK